MSITNTLKQLILTHAPRSIQNLAITIFNTRQYQLRKGGAYKGLREFYRDAQTWDHEKVAQEQERRKIQFLDFVAKNCPWYKNYNGSKVLTDYPVLTKRHLIDHLDRMATLPSSNRCNNGNRRHHWELFKGYL